MPTHTPAAATVSSIRSRVMAAVPQKHSKPERAARRRLHAQGYRYRLHVRELPGSPDLVFPFRRKVLFAHGCFWHRDGCKRTTTPATRIDFWQAKFDANVARDRRNIREFRRQD